MVFAERILYIYRFITAHIRKYCQQPEKQARFPHVFHCRYDSAFLSETSRCIFQLFSCIRPPEINQDLNLCKRVCLSPSYFSFSQTKRKSKGGTHKAHIISGPLNCQDTQPREARNQMNRTSNKRIKKHKWR